MPKRTRSATTKSLLPKTSSKHGHSKSARVSINLIELVSEKANPPSPRPSTLRVVKADREALHELDILMTTADSVIIVEGKQQTTVSGKPFRTIKHVVHALGSTSEDAETELTSQETADLLNVSRPYVIKLARNEMLPHHMVGNRHRFLLSDVLAYRKKQSVERDEALRALAPAGGYTAEDF